MYLLLSPILSAQPKNVPMRERIAPAESGV
jgi:hypothetical protein